MTTLTVPGKSQGKTSKDETSKIFGDLLKVELTEAVQIDHRLFDTLARSARGEGEAVDTGEVDVETGENTLVQIEFANDIKIWTTPEQARVDFAGRGQRSGEEASDIPPVLHFGPATRGVGAWVLKGLRFLDIRPDEAIAKKGATELAKALEARIGREEGLYKFERPDQTDPVLVQRDDIPTDRPILVLIHGTASMTGASFLGLTQQSEEQKRKGEPSTWNQLVNQYGGHIYGFEHRTLSENPIQNAINLVESLPKDARLHMVGYSRGGIVGELIARVNGQDLKDQGEPVPRTDPFDSVDGDFFAKWRGDPEWEKENPKDAEAIRARRQADKSALEKLNGLLKDRRPIVERFVRVGCPANGTTLASGRLDLYLSVIVNLIGNIPFLRDNPIYELTTAILQAFVSMRTDPRVVPGLEAQMPESPLINMLNRRDIQVTGPLCVIAGDIQPSGILRSLKVLATDLFYWDEHDLVVKTNEMLGGTTRADGTRYFFDKGPEVNHFTYFSNPRTASRIVDALDGDVSKFASYEMHRPLKVAARGKVEQRDRTEVPTVFVLPGTMGSHLKEHDRRLWLNFRRLAFGAIETLADLENESIAPDGPIEGYYGELIDYVAKDNFVIPFAYDWRKPIVEEAQRLAEQVEIAMGASTKPIRFLAHSMGGLVVRAMMAENNKTWQKVKERGDTRFVMLGTPNGGSHAIVAQLVGRAGTINKLHSVDVTHSKREVLNYVRQLPGILQLLPQKGREDFFDVQTWETLHRVYDKDWGVPKEDQLAAAKQIRNILAKPESRDDALTCYVAGTAQETPINVVPDTTVFGMRRLKVLSTPKGDGQVPWKTGIIDETRTWYARVDHGTLPRNSPDFPAYAELLETGKTSRLPRQADATRRGTMRDQEMSETALENMSPADFNLMPMGGPSKEPKSSEAPKAVVEIRHANLAFCGEVIAVGHYENDLLMSAEKYIDSRLDYRLTTRRALGLYPGALDTADVLFNLSEYPEDIKGALIVGLGTYGQLTMEALTRTLANAFLHYALKVCERPDHDGGNPLTLGTLLIGHSESRLTLRQSLRATLQALLRANTRIEEINQGGSQTRIDPIARLVLVELFEDTAIKAASILMSEKDDRIFSAQLDINHELKVERGGLRRAAEDDNIGYLQRVQIEKSKVAGEEDTLVFTSHSDYALAAQDLHVQDRKLVDRMVDAITSSTTRSDDLSQILFELLVPQGLKQLASDRRGLQFILDETAAAYPWELLDNKFSGLDRPIAVSTNVTRQLIQTRSVVGQFSAKTRGVLVIGDPPSEEFQELPGAQEEAQIVAGIFTDAETWGKVPALIKPDASRVFKEVLLGANRIVHLAGHGVYDHGPSQDTGMVLGHGVFLSPQTIQSLSHPPEFVFLNCCYLGKIARPDGERASWLNRHKLAANLGVAFIQAGAKAVIAAGWEVEDVPAREFASTFYEQMIRHGATFADAVRMGREAAYMANPSSNTWGAYQSYGDASYRFRSDTGRKRSNTQRAKFAAKAQAINAITNVSQRADVTRDAAYIRLSQELDDIVSQLPEKWKADAELNDALGAAYSNLGRFNDAITAYNWAIQANDSSYTVRAVEQRANLRARVAGLWVIAAEKAGTDVEAAMTEAGPQVGTSIHELEDLSKAIKDKETAERLRLIASAYKRKCLTLAASSVETLKTVGMMADYYLRAFDASFKEDNQEEYDADPALNTHLSLILLKVYTGRNRSSKKLREKLEAQIAEAESCLPRVDSILSRLARETDAHLSFWSLAMIGNALLTKHLAAMDLADGTSETSHADSVIAAYQRAWKNGGHSRNLSSVIETIDFLWVMLHRIRGNDSAVHQLCDALKEISQSLERMAETRT
ncbi:MAG: CHAT domain-containing protein [Pseudomonadota bacterium]